MHEPGSMRFCNWLCHDGYREDCRHGLVTLSRAFAEAGCCMYCGRDVATNAQRRSSPSAAEDKVEAAGAEPATT